MAYGVINLPNMRQGYIDLIREVHDNGRRRSPRGIPTIELRDTVFTVEDVTECLPIGIGRRPNLAIAAAEAIQIIGGFSRPELLTAVSSNFLQFMDDGEFHGAYGNRIGGQLLDVERKLRADPDTRQAVISLWDPKLDNIPGRHDYPCTLTLTFAIDEDRLNLGVHMRSNDVWLGVAYDVFVFTQVQHTLARALEVPVGEYIHYADSLHLYERDIPKVERLHQDDGSTWERPTGFGVDPSSILGFARGSLRSSMQHAAEIGRWGNTPANLTASERWYLDTLRDYL